MIFDEKLQELPDFVVDRPNITLSGRSIPADAKEFYFSIIKKVEETVKYWPKIVFTFDCSYYNTSSTHYLSKIIETLGKGGKKVLINWYYIDSDDDMLELGEDFKEQVNCNFKLIKK